MTTNPYDGPVGNTSGTNSESKKDVAKDKSKQEAGALKNEAAGSGQHVKETAKEQATAVKDEATHQAQDLLGQLRDDLKQHVGPQQERVASSARSVSDEINALSRGEKPQSDYVTGLLGKVAGPADSLASSLENKDAKDLLEDVRRFAARRPGTFLCVAAGIGLLAGRTTRGAKDSGQLGSGQSTGQSGQGVPSAQAGAAVPTAVAYDEGYEPGLTGTETSGYTPGDPYAYRSDEQGEAARTYTDPVPGTVYPEQGGDRR